MAEYAVKEEIQLAFAKLMEQEAVKRGLLFLEKDQARAIEEQKMLVVGGGDEILHKVAVGGVERGNAFAATALLLVVVEACALKVAAPGKG